MGNNLWFVLLFLLSTLISSFSQILLKKSAQRIYPNRIREYLNPLVIIAYFLFFGCTILVAYSYRGISISLGPVLEASAYIYIMLLSLLFLKETITVKKIVGNLLIVVGICIFSVFG
jgi:small multidrug resistance pump